MKKWLIIPDTHWDATEELHPSYLLVKKFAKDFKPDGIIHLGDLFDFAYIAKFNKEKLRTISGKTFRRDYDLGNREFDFWQKVNRGGSFIVRQGNHDERVDRVIDKEPMLEGFIEVEDNLRFKERGIKYYRETDSPTKLGKLHVIHGWYWTVHHAKKHLHQFGGNIVYGHVHEVQTYTEYFPAFDGEVSAWCLGCLSDTQPAWHKGRPTRWAHAFGIVFIEPDGNFNLYTVRITNNQFIWDGHTFK